MFFTGEQSNFALFAFVGYAIYSFAPRMSGWQKTAHKVAGLVIMVPSVLLLMFPSLVRSIHTLLR